MTLTITATTIMMAAILAYFVYGFLTSMILVTTKEGRAQIAEQDAELSKRLGHDAKISRMSIVILGTLFGGFMLGVEWVRNLKLKIDMKRKIWTLEFNGKAVVENVTVEDCRQAAELILNASGTEGYLDVDVPRKTVKLSIRGDSE